VTLPARRRVGLTFRITLAFALGALAISAAVAISAYVFAVRFQVNEQQHVALRQTYLNAAIARARLLDPDTDVVGVLDALTTGSTSHIVIYHQGRWYSSSLAPSRDALPASARTATMRGAVTRTWARIGGAPQIVVGVPLPAVHSAFFQVFDESALRRTLVTLRTILLVAASGTTAAGAAFGWWASRRLTAPLRDVATAAQRIAAGDLDTRLRAGNDVELAALVASFNTMVEALRARIERDARFAADVGHELRSPLTTLSTSLAVLRRRRDELSDRGRDALDLLTVELSRFERLVDDLLEISRSDAQTGAVELQPVRVGELVLNLLERPEYAGVRAAFEGDALDVVVAADKRRLEQVLRNLLDNAATHGGGATEIQLRTDDGEVVLAVDDAGPGIPPDERERVFDRFTRGRNAARRASRGGTGLGLALVREHVRVHHGRVWVEDAPSGGARFVVTLPRAGS
jgi:signal transduction histidine kinase